MTRKWFVASTLVVALVSVPAFAATPSFQGLGDLPGGDFESEAYAVSADGRVVVGWSQAVNAQAFCWPGGGPLHGLPSYGQYPPGSEAFTVSADGTVIAGQSGGYATYWTGHDPVGLGKLPGGISASSVTGISADGTVLVGWSGSTGGRQPFRWTASTGMAGLGFFGGGTEAHGVSADGSVVVGTGEDGREAFRWTEATGFVGLGNLTGPGGYSNAIAVSADGQAVVGWSYYNRPEGPPDQAFLWTEDNGMVGMGYLSIHGSTRAYAVSADGSVVVGMGAWAGAFIWDRTNGMRHLQSVLTDCGLDLAGWNLREANGISADGLTIVGTGTNPYGEQEAWVATIPEPATVCLLALGLAGLLTTRTARKGATE